MTISVINVGFAPNDNTGDTLRQAFIKVNNNFDYMLVQVTSPTFTTANVTGALVAGSVTTDNLTVNNSATIAKLLTANAQITGGTIANVSIINSTGSFTTIAGTIITAAQPNITSLGTLTSLAVSGATTTGTLFTTNAQIAGGSITNTPIAGSTGLFTTLQATGGITGTLQTASQPNITSLGTLTGLTVSGTATAGVLSTANAQITGGSITGTPISGSTGSFTSLSVPAINNTVIGNVTPAAGSFTTLSATSGITGTLQTAAQPNITSVGTLGSLTVSGALNATLSTAAQPNITSVGTLGSLAVTGNVTAGGFVGPVYGQLKTNAQPNITSLGTLLTPLEISANSDGSYQVPYNAGVVEQMTGTPGLVSRLYVDAQANYAVIAGRRYNGNTAQPSGVLNNDIMFRVAATPYGADGWATQTNRSSPRMDFIANENQTTANLGARIEFWTAPIQSNINVKVATIEPAAGVTATMFTGPLTGTVQTAAQPNITSLGTLTSLTVSGTTSITSTTQSTGTANGALVVSGGVGIAKNLYVGGDTTITGNLTILGTQDIVNSTTLAIVDPLIDVGTGANNAPLSSDDGQDRGIKANYYKGSAKAAFWGMQSSTQNFEYLTNITVTSGVVSGTPGKAVFGSASLSDATASTSTSTGALVVTGGVGVGGNVYAGNVFATNLTGTLQTAAQPNITSVGTLTSLTVSGSLSATLSTAAQPNITSVGTLTSLTVSGASTSFTAANAGIEVGSTSSANSPYIDFHSSGNNIDYDVRLIASGGNASVGYGNLAVTTSNATFSGNILTTGTGTFNIGSSANKFGTFYGLATSAQYADLAEIYASDIAYDPGSVLVFGGPDEVTATTTVADVSVAGVVSTAPAYLMNAGAEYETPVAVALRGRVPVRVIGPVEKGDLLVTTSVPGFAQSVGKDSSYGKAIFAKAIETNLDAGAKIITAVIL